MGKENESKEKLTDLTKVTQKIVGFPGDASGIKNSPANAGDVRDVGSIPGSGRSPGGGHGNSLQYSCLENLMDRGTWRDTVHGMTESDTTEAIKLTHTHTEDSKTSW